jgi:hypothetical protein
MDNNKQQNTKSKCTCIEHDPYCCQIHGNCPVCVKPEDPEDVVLGYKTSLVAQTLDSKGNKQQTVVEWLEIELEKLWVEKYLSPITIKPLLDKAKEIEKQMTIKLYADYENYLEEAFKNQCGGQAVILSFQEFYEQNYGGNK